MNHSRPPTSAGANTTSTENSSSQGTNETSLIESHVLGNNRSRIRGGTESSSQRSKTLGRKYFGTQSPKFSSQIYEYNLNHSEYLSGDNFSRSFNSLILEDIKDEVKETALHDKKTINRSPPFNVKSDLYKEETTGLIVEGDEGKFSTIDSFIANSSSDTENDLPTHSMDATSHSNSSANIYNAITASSYLITPYKNTAAKPCLSTASSQTSIKRSSKFLNLALDSNIKERDREKKERPGNERKEFGSEINTQSSPFPLVTSSPVDGFKSTFNKFKRPHQLVSQSPSPNQKSFSSVSRSNLNASKLKSPDFSLSNEDNSTENFHNFGLGTKASKSNEVPTKIARLFTSSNDEKSNELFNIQSLTPSKFRTKGLRLFRNTGSGSKVMHRDNDVNSKESHSSNTLAPQKALTSKKALSPSFQSRLNYSGNSPFRVDNMADTEISPASNFEYYNLDNLDAMELEDSPSKPYIRPPNFTTNLHGQNEKHLDIAHSLAQDINKLRSDTGFKSFTIFKDRKDSDNQEKALLSPTRPLELSDKENAEIKEENTASKPSYKFVKPLQTAFKSAGLMKKNSITKDNENKLPPETPIKRHPLAALDNLSNSGTPISLSSKLNTENPKSKFKILIDSISHDQEENISDMSIEIGRERKEEAYNDSPSIITITSPNEQYNERTTKPVFSSNFLSVENESNENIPETPTKPMRKSSSTPANFSPVAFARVRNNLLLGRSAKKRGIGGNRIPQEFVRTRKEFEIPSTPRSRNLRKRSESSSNLENLISTSSQVTICNNEVLPNRTDDHLTEKFGMKNIKYLASGSFSIAFECSFQDQRYAIKRSKKPVLGRLERKAIEREIEALRALSSVKENENADLEEQAEGKSNLVYFIEAWEFKDYYYIMTEFCEGGTLYDFLEENKNYRIDEFRIWKILIEILNGLKFIHSHNYLHLDIKPANIFVTFEGNLKIGDFGLTTKLPILENDFDLEGDRNYIAPELINDKIYTPFADIFSVGLIILEIAANIVLPDNGSPWRKLRSGDLSDAGKLSSDNLSDFLNNRKFSSLTSYNSDFIDPFHSATHVTTTNNRNLPSELKKLIPEWAPSFLVACNSDNLDRIVSKMLKPNPFDRPTAKMILEMEECVIIDDRRKAGATIYEGEFGPEDEE